MNSAAKGYLELTAQIVSAHIKHNAVNAAELPGLILAVHQVLTTVGTPEELHKPAVALVPAVPVKRSVFPDHIVCLEDGRKVKMLKRHLMNVYGMTPKDYRIKWGLPVSYPMVAPEYAQRRSVLAKQIGLGRQAGTPLAVTDTPEGDATATASEPKVQVLPERKRGRPKEAA